MNKDDINRLSFNLDENQKVRSVQKDGKEFIEGYALLFNQKSRLFYENGKFLYEHINIRALEGVLDQKDIDVKATYIHDRLHPLARLQPSKGKHSLELSIDDIGLKFRFEKPNTTLGNDVAELLKRDIVSESSVGFTTPLDGSGERKYRGDNNQLTVEITKIDTIFDITICPDGVYPTTISKVSKRSLDDFIESEMPEKDHSNEYKELELQLLKLNL